MEKKKGAFKKKKSTNEESDLLKPLESEKPSVRKRCLD